MDVNAMTFGVEIECAVSSRAFAEAGWYESPYHGGTGRETNGDFPGWRVEHDSSVGSAVSFAPGMRGIEVISPVLHGREGLAEVSRVAARLRAMGGKVNATCGFHVHVGFPTEEVPRSWGGASRQVPDVRALVRLVFVTAAHEDALYAVTGTPSRREAYYARPIRTDYRPAVSQPVATMQEFKQRFKDDDSAYDRRHVLNLRNILADPHTVTGRIKKPTVEFRVFAGTLNGTKMRGYVQLCLGLVQYAVEELRKTRWAPLPNVWLPRVLPGAGPGEVATHQLFARLGWERSYSRHLATRRGVVDPDGLTAAMTLLLQLARKYDGGPRRAENVWPTTDTAPEPEPEHAEGD